MSDLERFLKYYIGKDAAYILTGVLAICGCALIIAATFGIIWLVRYAVLGVL